MLAHAQETQKFVDFTATSPPPSHRIWGAFCHFSQISDGAGSFSPPCSPGWALPCALGSACWGAALETPRLSITTHCLPPTHDPSLPHHNIKHLTASHIHPQQTSTRPAVLLSSLYRWESETLKWLLWSYKLSLYQKRSDPSLASCWTRGTLRPLPLSPQTEHQPQAPFHTWQLVQTWKRVEGKANHQATTPHVDLYLVFSQGALK